MLLCNEWLNHHEIKCISARHSIPYCVDIVQSVRQLAIVEGEELLGR